MNEPPVEVRATHDGSFVRLLPDGEWFRMGCPNAIRAAPPALRARLSRRFAAEGVKPFQPCAVPMKVVVPPDVALLLEQAAERVGTASIVDGLRVALQVFLQDPGAPPSPPPACFVGDATHHLN